MNRKLVAIFSIIGIIALLATMTSLPAQGALANQIETTPTRTPVPPCDDGDQGTCWFERPPDPDVSTWTWIGSPYGDRPIWPGGQDVLQGIRNGTPARFTVHVAGTLMVTAGGIVTVTWVGGTYSISSVGWSNRIPVQAGVITVTVPGETGNFCWEDPTQLRFCGLDYKVYAPIIARSAVQLPTPTVEPPPTEEPTNCATATPTPWPPLVNDESCTPTPTPTPYPHVTSSPTWTLACPFNIQAPNCPTWTPSRTPSPTWTLAVP